MIVVDASALADVLLPTELGRELQPIVSGAGGNLHAPSLVDAEVTSVVRRAERRSELSKDRARQVLDDLAGAPLTRHPYQPLLGRVWELRHNFSVHDGVYVALAEALSAPFLTTDAPLGIAVKRHTGVPVLPD